MRSYNQIPCCFKRSRVIFLDDNTQFLKGLRIVLPDDLYWQSYANSQKLAADLLDYQVDSFVEYQQLDKSSRYEAAEPIELSSLHQEVFRDDRFDEISALVSDYAMPGLNGLEVCRQLEQKPFRKILLTGEAGYELAVTAFNENIIQQFVLKNSPEYVENIIEAINEQQMKYYLEISNHLISKLPANFAETLGILKDNVFVEFFKKLYRENEIVEYYLLDQFGSFLMLDRDANRYWLIVKDDEEVHNLAEFADIESAPSTVVKSLQTREKIPFFYTQEDFATPPAQWGRYLHSVNVIDGDHGKYFYSVLKNPTLYQLSNRPVKSFQSFVE